MYVCVFVGVTAVYVHDSECNCVCVCGMQRDCEGAIDRLNPILISGGGDTDEK